MIKYFILVLLFTPLFASADTYQDAAGVAKSIGDYFSDFWDFFDNDVPNFFQRALTYILEKIVLFKINAQIEATKLAWSVAKAVFENFQIGSKLANAATALPRDVQAAIVDMRLFDGLNIVINAFIARYVMRFL